MKIIKLSEDEYIYPSHKLKIFTYKTPSLHTSVLVGIDPGYVNVGAAFWISENLFLCQFKFKSDKDIMRRLNVLNIGMSSCIDIVDPEITKRQAYGVVEGSSYHKTHGQAALGEARASLALALVNSKCLVQIRPPATIRKIAFGSAKIKAKELYPEIHPDAVAAFGCAITAGKIFEKIPTD